MQALEEEILSTKERREEKSEMDGIFGVMTLRGEGVLLGAPIN